MTRYRLDPSWRRPGDGRVVVAGSPLRLFRLSEGGAHVIAQLEAGSPPDTAAVRQFVDRFVDAGAVHPQPTRGPFGLDDVTVVMPHWSPGSGRLTAAIPHGVRTVVVDDASPGWVPPDDADHLQVLRREHNGGPAAARNTGLAAVTTPVVAFVDTDVVLPDDTATWLAPLLAHFDDPRVAMVAPRVASLPGDSRLAGYEQRHSPLDLGAEPARVAPGTRVSYVPAAVLVCRADIVRDLGGFDEGMRLGEDVDLVWRAVGAGHRVRYEPGVVVHHRPRAHWGDLWRQRAGYGRSAAPLSARHHAAVAPLRTSGWSLAVCALAACRRPFVALGLAAATGVALHRRLRHLPPLESARMVAVGHLHALRQVAVATRRVWWPLAAVLAVVSRRARPVVAGAFVLPELVEAAMRRTARPLADLPLAVADDVAYGAGVWLGVRETGQVGALLPEITTWPQRGDG
ncbi:MAG: mycofactocin biosynthesis glycosyltransferase MftF [Ilumatobacteraceae bacterium]